MKRIGTLALVCILACSAGCAYFAQNPRLNATRAQEQVVQADLPVPEGFALDRDDTLRHERTGFRRLRLTYRRREYLGEDRTVEFVRRAYEEAGWGLAFVYGLDRHHFIFHRGGEQCHVEVREDFGRRITTLVVDVEPWATPDGELVARQGPPQEPAPTAPPADAPAPGPDVGAELDGIDGRTVDLDGLAQRS